MSSAIFDVPLDTRSRNSLGYKRSDSGSVVMLVVVVMFVFSLTLAAIARSGSVLITQARADTIADAVALAAAAEDRAAGQKVASSNYSTIEAMNWRADGAVEVRISHKGFVAVAAAIESD